jgi:sarcosine oxidase/L-pipecolate oxidase
MDQKIVIVGSGVFGLSAALHLSLHGYTDISVIDRLDQLKIGYSFEGGAKSRHCECRYKQAI